MQHTLEELLEKAAQQPGWRPAFFACLLKADIFIPVNRPLSTEIEQTIDLPHWRRADGSEIIPFFSTEARLRAVCDDEVRCLPLPAEQLFAMTQGQVLMLDPELPTGKVFTATEIAALLDNQGNALSGQHLLEGEQRLLLSALSEPPAQLIQSLQTLFSQYKTVRQAFIAGLKEADDQREIMLIGLELENDPDPDGLIQATGNVAIDTLPDQAEVDVCLVTAGEMGVSHFMLAHLTPFYQRRWGSFIRDIQPVARII